MSPSIHRPDPPAPGRAPSSEPERAPARASVWATLLLALVIWAGLRLIVVESYRIPSASMAPTLLPGDWVFVPKWVYGPVLGPWHLPGRREPRRGDLVVFPGVEPPHAMLVKRLVALPGDTVAMVRDTLWRNGRPVAEPYRGHDASDPDADRVMAVRLERLTRRLGVPASWAGPVAAPGPSAWGPIVVPAGHALVLGDNRGVSYDSRFWGVLPLAQIRGTPGLIYYSAAPDHLGAVRFDRLGRHPE